MAHVYRNISRPIFILGLEIIDVLIVAIVFAGAFVLSEHIVVNIAIVATVYTTLRFFKKDRPQGYTMQFFRFIASRPVSGVSLRDTLIRYQKQ